MEQKHLKVLLAVLTVVATMGCTKEFGRNDPGNAPSPFTRVTEDEITFAALETKADVPMTQPFSVTAVWSGGTLMDEQTVSWNGSAYEYAPIKYWPQGCDEMSYNAYAPASAAGVDASSAPLYDFTLPEDASVDLMTAPTMTKTSNDGPVTFGFKHALSRISLIGYLTEEPSEAKCVRVTGIRINNQPSNGTWNADSAEWTEVGTDLVTVNRVCSVDIPEDGTPAGELYLLPGVAPEGTTLEIDWEIYVKSTGVASYSSTVSVDLSGKTFGKNTRIAGNLGINGRADIITFADPAVKAVCVAHWDTDGDGEISYNEASAVTDSMFGTKFRNNTEIVSFDELNYFTGVTALPAYSFSGCTSLESVNIVNCTSIGNEAFRNDTALKSIDLSSILTIGN